MITTSASSNPKCGLTIEVPSSTAKMVLRIAFSTKSTNGNGLISAITSKQCPSSQTTPVMTNPTTM